MRKFFTKDTVITALLVGFLFVFAFLMFMSSMGFLLIFSKHDLFYGAVLSALLVGFLANMVVIFGVRMLDDFGANHNWSQETKRRINYGFLSLSALVIIILAIYLDARFI